MSNTYKIAVGKHGGFLPNGGPKLGTLTEGCKEVTWKQLAQTMCKHKETESKNEPGTTYIVGGYFSGTHRIKAEMLARSLVTMDIDFLDPWDDGEQMIRDAYDGLAYIAHTTFSHSADTPKWRVLLPLSREISDWVEYEAVARRLADRLSIEAVDSVSFRPAQLMWRPSCPPGADYAAFYCDGADADVDAILGSYEDYRDFGEMPRRTEDLRVNSEMAKAGSPYEKPGAIGAFNRVFDIGYAIEHFSLPYEPESDGSDGRWGYTLRSGSPACRIYDLENPGVPTSDGCFMYSDHNSDPARGNHNAYDMVRLHLFGDLDSGYEGAYAKSPSQEAMREFVLTDERCSEVVSLLAVDDGMEDLGPIERVETENGSAPLETPKEKSLASKIVAKILARTAPYSSEDVQRVIAQVAVAGLMPHQIEEIASHLKDASATAISKKSIIDSVKAFARNTRRQDEEGSPNDIDEDLAQRVLDDFYEGGAHLRRFGGLWWIYDGGVWRTTHDEVIAGAVAHCLIGLRKDRPNDAAHLVAAVGESSTVAMYTSISKLLASMTASRYDAPDPLQLTKAKAPVINCLNGEIHFKRDGTFEFTEHHPELFLTSQTPVVYDPDATCPSWDAFCQDMLFHNSFEPDEMQRHLEEFCGYVIQPSRWLRAFAVLRGIKGAGKSTVGAVLTAILQSSAAVTNISRYDDRGNNDHATAYLVGKLMVLDDDFPDNSAVPERFVKTAAEGRMLQGNPKSKDEFSYICRAMPVIVSNHWPNARTLDEAMLDRALVWDFTYSLPREKRDDSVVEQMISEELPGILNRFIDGFCRLRQRGDWDTPEECADALQGWRMNANQTATFAREHLVSKEGSSVRAADIYQQYKTWHRDEGAGHPVGSRKFYDQLRDLGFVSGRTGKIGVMFRDLKVIPVHDEAFD